MYQQKLGLIPLIPKLLSSPNKTLKLHPIHLLRDMSLLYSQMSQYPYTKEKFVKILDSHINFILPYKQCKPKNIRKNKISLPHLKTRISRPTNSILTTLLLRNKKKLQIHLNKLLEIILKSSITTPIIKKILNPIWAKYANKST